MAARPYEPRNVVGCRVERARPLRQRPSPPGARLPGPRPVARGGTAAIAAAALADRFGDAAAVVACVDATGLWTPEVTEAVVAKRAATKVMERRAVADALATAPAGDDVDEAFAALLEDADAGVRASAEYAMMTQAAAAEDKLVRRRLRGDDDGLRRRHDRRVDRGQLRGRGLHLHILVAHLLHRCFRMLMLPDSRQ